MILQGSWSFEENAGTTSVDTSGTGRTMVNIPGWTGAGHTGTAVLLNGTLMGGQVTLESTYYLHSASTFMCWVKFNATGAYQEVVYGPRYGSNGEWYMGITPAGLPIVAWGDGNMTGVTPLATGVWYHMAFAFDWASGSGGGDAQLYVNGVQVASSVNTFPLDAGTLYWGGYDLPVNGTIDDARWYSDQLSQSDVQTLMGTPVPSLLANSGTKRFYKDTSGDWQPLHTQRIVNPSSVVPYGWLLTPKDVGLNKFGINGHNLPVYNGPQQPSAGAVIIGKKITMSLDLSNGNITIERCFIQPASVPQGVPVLCTYDFDLSTAGAGPVTIKDCTISGELLSQHDAAMSSGIQGMGTITGNYITGLGSGIAVMGAGDTGNCLVEGNYVTGLVAWGDPATDGNHSDAFTVRDFSAVSEPGRQIIVRNNRFDCRSGNDTGSCFLQTYAGPIDNVLIQGNLLEGYGFNMGLNELTYSYSNISSINNRFSPLGFGPSYIQGGGGYVQWTNNYLDDPAQPDHVGVGVNPT